MDGRTRGPAGESHQIMIAEKHTFIQVTHVLRQTCPKAFQYGIANAVMSAHRPKASGSLPRRMRVPVVPETRIRRFRITVLHIVKHVPNNLHRCHGPFGVGR